MTRRERYTLRKDARLCVFCSAGLQDVDGVTCLECTARKASARARYATSVAGRTASRRYLARRWRRRMEDGQCGDCSRPAAPGRARCDYHLACKAAAQSEYLDRREAA